MSPVKSNNKLKTGVPGVKLLIAASSLAATVGGWALISAQETTPARPAQPATSAQVIAPQAAPVLSIKLAPLPTLVPAMSSQGQVVTVSNARAANAPRPAAVAVQAAPQPALVLRDVSAPASGGASAGPAAGAPPPATNTGSSR